MSDRVAIIGAGLLGGSFGLAYRQRHPHAEVIGVSRSAASREQALQSGAVTCVTADLQQACQGSQLIVVAVPVDGIMGIASQACRWCAAGGLVLDLGSTKSTIVRGLEQEPHTHGLFIGTHPIAGSEKTGAKHARADLFASKTVIVTPGKWTPQNLVERAQSLWQSFDANVVQMTPEEHDVALASVSHLPHLVASMLAGLLAPQSQSLVGTGWLDTTRVASGDPELWTAICRENSPAIVAELRRAEGWLSELAAHLNSGDYAAVHALLEHAKQVRDQLLPAKLRTATDG